MNSFGGQWPTIHTIDPNWWAISSLLWVAGVVLVVLFFNGAYAKDRIIERRLDKLKQERLVWDDLHKRHVIPQVYGTHLDPDIISRQLEGQ